MLKPIAAVVAAGIVGTLANSLAVTVAFGAPLVPLALSPGRNAVAILVAVLIPLIDRTLSGLTANAAALVALAVIPSVLARLVFGIEAPWPALLALNGVYAVAAIIAYRLVMRTPAGRSG
jgi:hypothetical protein